LTPTVLSWQLNDGYAASFDYPGTWDYAGWLAAPHGLAYWEDLGGWAAVARLADLVADGQKRVAEALGVSLERLPDTPAPAMRLVPLPGGVLTSPDQVDPFYEACRSSVSRSRRFTSMESATCASRRHRTTPQMTMTGWPTPSGTYWTDMPEDRAAPRLP
jgi:hypothetical protein